MLLYVQFLSKLKLLHRKIQYWYFFSRGLDCQSMMWCRGVVMALTVTSVLMTVLRRDVRILRKKNCKFCVPFLPILRNISTRSFYGTIVRDTSVLSRVSWLVGPLKIRVTIQLTLSLRSYLLTTRSSNNIVWRMFIVCERKLTTSGILCDYTYR